MRTGGEDYLKWFSGVRSSLLALPLNHHRWFVLHSFSKWMDKIYRERIVNTPSIFAFLFLLFSPFSVELYKMFVISFHY